MIVVSIDILDSHAIVVGGDRVELDEREQLIEALRPLAVFGPVQLRIQQADERLLAICKHLFQKFDCWLSFETLPDLQTLFTWLDAGAKKLAVLDRARLPAELHESLPENRRVNVVKVNRLDATQEFAVIDAREIRSSEEFVEAFCDRLTSDRQDGMWPTIVADEYGVALGLVYSNRESVARAVLLGKGVYWSRSRNELWEKGKTSGATSQLLKIAADCDRDALQFTVKQQPPGFCHLETRSCFGAFQDLSTLHQWISKRAEDASGYTARLLNDAELLRSKLTEEAGELADATDIDEATWEAADVIYFTMVAMTRAGISFDQVTRELERRTGQLIRRKGDAKKNP